MLAGSQPGPVLLTGGKLGHEADPYMEVGHVSASCVLCCVINS